MRTFSEYYDSMIVYMTKLVDKDMHQTHLNVQENVLIKYISWLLHQVPVANVKFKYTHVFIFNFPASD